jgi:hypothetical protein
MKVLLFVLVIFFSVRTTEAFFFSVIRHFLCSFSLFAGLPFCEEDDEDSSTMSHTLKVVSEATAIAGSSTEIRGTTWEANFPPKLLLDMKDITSISLNTADGVALKYVLARSEADSWFGEEVGGGTANFVNSGAWVSGTFTDIANEKVYIVCNSYSSSNSLRVKEIDTSDMPEGGEPIGRHRDLEVDQPLFSRRLQDTTMVEINVFAFYTESAVCAGFAAFEPNCLYSEKTTQDMVTSIKNAVYAANNAFKNSGVFITLKLVGTGLLLGYKENEYIDGSALLVAFRDDPMVKVEVPKNQVDLFTLFIADSSIGGHGYLFTNGDPQGGFSIVNREQAATSFTLAHEVAHNMVRWIVRCEKGEI